MARRWVIEPDGSLRRVSVPMIALVVPNAVVMRFIWSESGTDSAVNVLGLSNPNALTIDQAFTNTIGTAVKNAFVSSGLQIHIGQNVALNHVGLRNISAPNQYEFLDAAIPQPGTGASDTLPLNVTYCLTLRTALAGRSYRGRYYQSGFDEAENSNIGVPAPAVATSTKAFIDAVNTAVQSHGVTLAVISRKLLGVNNVTQTTARTSLWTTQRRRVKPGI